MAFNVDEALAYLNTLPDAEPRIQTPPPPDENTRMLADYYGVRPDTPGLQQAAQNEAANYTYGQRAAGGFVRGLRDVHTDMLEGAESLAGLAGYGEPNFGAADRRKQSEFLNRNFPVEYTAPEGSGLVRKAGNFLRNIPIQTAQMAGPMVESIAAGAATGLVGAPGAGTLGYWGLQGGGQVKHEMEDAGVDPRLATLTAIPTGLGYGLIEQTQIGQLLPDSVQKKAVGGLMRKLIFQEAPTTMGAAGRQYLKNVGREVGEEGLQEGTLIGGHNIGANIENNNGGNASSVGLNEAGARVGGALAYSVGPMALLGAPRGLHGAYRANKYQRYLDSPQAWQGPDSKSWLEDKAARQEVVNLNQDFLNNRAPVVPIDNSPVDLLNPGATLSPIRTEPIPAQQPNTSRAPNDPNAIIPALGVSQNDLDAFISTGIGVGPDVQQQSDMTPNEYGAILNELLAERQPNAAQRAQFPAGLTDLAEQIRIAQESRNARMNEEQAAIEYVRMQQPTLEDRIREAQAIRAAKDNDVQAAIEYIRSQQQQAATGAVSVPNAGLMPGERGPLQAELAQQTMPAQPVLGRPGMQRGIQQNRLSAREAISVRGLQNDNESAIAYPPASGGLRISGRRTQPNAAQPAQPSQKEVIPNGNQESDVQAEVQGLRRQEEVMQPETGAGVSAAPAPVQNAPSQESLANIPDDLISVFPDIQLTAEGYIPLNRLSKKEQKAVSDAGLVESITKDNGETYQGVSDTYLWEERKRRQEKNKNKQSSISQEEINRNIENRAQIYDRYAETEEALGDLADQEKIGMWREKAAEARSRKKEATPNSAPASNSFAPGDLVYRVVSHAVDSKGRMATSVDVGRVKNTDAVRSHKDRGSVETNSGNPSLSSIQSDGSVTSEWKPIGDGIPKDVPSHAHQNFTSQLERFKPKTEDAPVSKAPWEMTREEFSNEAGKGTDPYHSPYGEFGISNISKALGIPESHLLSSEMRSGHVRTNPILNKLRASGIAHTFEDAAHHEIVSEAVREGKPVPPEVLAEYPDLAARETANDEPQGGKKQPWEMSPDEWYQHSLSEYKKDGKQKLEEQRARIRTNWKPKTPLPEGIDPVQDFLAYASSKPISKLPPDQRDMLLSYNLALNASKGEGNAPERRHTDAVHKNLIERHNSGADKEAFNKAYRDAFAQANKYDPKTVGHADAMKRMAELYDLHPGWADELEGAEQDALKTTESSRRQGKIGDMLSPGEVVLTTSGRETTPFPKFDVSTDRKAQSAVKSVNAWLIENAVSEAESRGDDFNASQFKTEDAKSIPQASKDSMEEYLFGEQPKVKKPILKPLVPAPVSEQPAPETPATPQSHVLNNAGKPFSGKKPAQVAAKKEGVEGEPEKITGGWAVRRGEARPVAMQDSGAVDNTSEPEKAHTDIPDTERNGDITGLNAELQELLDSGGTSAEKGRVMRKIARRRGLSDKHIQEVMEGVILWRAQYIIDHAKSPKEAFFALVEMYNRQPLLSSRTSTSVENQAYSTPIPLAYAASRMIKAEEGKRILEPTAGTGNLILDVGPAAVTANEINPLRRALLERPELAIGRVTSEDATKSLPSIKGGYDKILMNSPFGKFKDTAFYTFVLKKLEHVIAARALEEMAPDGQAIMILGANMQEGKVGQGAERIFMNFLYNRFNIVANFEVDGKLYDRQGAAWPVRVIVVSGKKANPTMEHLSPASVIRYNSWEDVWTQTESIRHDIEARMESMGNRGGSVNGDSDTAGKETANGHIGVSGATGDNVQGDDSPVNPGGSDRGKQGADGDGNIPGRQENDRGSGGEVRKPDAGSESLDKPDEHLVSDDGVRDRKGPEDASIGGEGAVESAGQPAVRLDTGSDNKPAGLPINLDDMTDDELDALFDAREKAREDAKSKSKEESPKPPAETGTNAPKREKKTKSESAPKTKKEAISNAAKETEAGLRAGMRGVSEFLGGERLGIVPQGFDEYSWKRAKAAFEELYQHFLAAGKSIADFIDMAIEEFGERARGIIKQWVRERKEDKAKTVAEQDPLLEKNPDDIYYLSGSKGNGLGTIIPRFLAEPTQNALSALRDEVGDIDKFVMGELDYGSADELYSAFSAEQIDGVALAIRSIKKGLGIIIGDQTGVGKGRQVAALIWWAKKNGMTPVFFTEKASLFTDIIRDMKDIGKDVNPFILSDKDKGIITDKDGSVLIKPQSVEMQRTTMKSVLDADWSATPEDAVFLTYSQINNVDGHRQKHDFLSHIANTGKTLLVLDEAHGAAGSESATGAFLSGGSVYKKDKATNQTIEYTFPGLIHNRGIEGVVYSSATFAKRPDNMALYARTGMARGLRSPGAIVDIMNRGGLGLQRIISGELARLGMFIRREKSFAGVSYDTKIVGEENAKAIVSQTDAATEILRDIVDFSDMFEMFAMPMFAGGGGATNTQSKFIASDFASVVHNNLSQLLMSIRSKYVADLAIESHKAGEKPVIVIGDTMESALKDLFPDAKDGDKVDGSFSGAMVRALNNILRVKEKRPNGTTIVHEISPSQLVGPIAVAYRRIVQDINNMDKSLPLVAIDSVKAQLRRAGINVDEVTGRKFTLEYNEDGTATVKIRTQKQVDDRNAIIRSFNDGTVNALVINAAGSTGLSIHASKKFKDKSMRHMIIAQPSLDINTYMQTLGRILRSGMVPGMAKYTQVALPIEAENRPMAILKKKMKSLNANTTADSESEVKIAAVDVFNKYGDYVVAQYLAENPGIERVLGGKVSINILSNGEVSQNQGEDFARKVFGKLGLQPNEQQKRIFAEIFERYEEYEKMLKEMGLYDLDISIHDEWGAVEKSSDVIEEGTDKSSTFTGDVVLKKYEINDNRAIPEWADVEREFRASFGQTRATAEKAFTDIVDDMKARLLAWEKVDKEKRGPFVIRALSNIDNNLLPIMRQLGETIELSTKDGETYNAVITGVQYKAPLDEKVNPALLSHVKITFHVDAPIKKIRISTSQIANDEFSIDPYDGSRKLDEIFSNANRKNRKVERYVFEGNPLRSLEVAGRGGQTTIFKDSNGNDITGIVMPLSWRIEQMADPRMELQVPDAVFRYIEKMQGWKPKVISAGDVLIEYTGGRYSFFTPGISKSKFEHIFLDATLRAITGDFEKRGSNWRTPSMDKDTALRAVQYLYQKTMRFVGTGRDMKGVSEANDLARNGTQFSVSPETSTPRRQMNARILERAVESMFARWKNGPKLVVVQSVADIADARVRADAQAERGIVRGAYDPVTDTVYLVGDGIQNGHEAAFVALHEVVGHRGLEAILGDDVDVFYDRMARELGRRFDGKREFTRKDAKEWLADRAAQWKTEPWWRRLIAMVRKALARMMPGRAFSDVELRLLVDDAGRYGEGRAVSGGMDARVARHGGNVSEVANGSAAVAFSAAKKTFRQIAHLLPKDPIPHPFILVRGKEAIMRAATAVFTDFSKEISAADGRSILLWNSDPIGPYKDGVLNRIHHLVTRPDRKTIDPQKAKWLPMVEETLKNAHVLTWDHDEKNFVYIRRYEGGVYHAVVVSGENIERKYDVVDSGLITQFPEDRKSRRWGFDVLWKNETGGTLASSGTLQEDVSGAAPSLPGQTDDTTLPGNTQTGISLSTAPATADDAIPAGPRGELRQAMKDVIGEFIAKKFPGFKKRLDERREIAGLRDVNGRVDLSMLDTALRTIQHYSEKVPQLRKIYEYAMSISDEKHMYKEFIFGDDHVLLRTINTFFHATMPDSLKGVVDSDVKARNVARADEAKRLNDYLWQRDNDAMGYKVKEDADGWKVMRPYVEDGAIKYEDVMTGLESEIAGWKAAWLLEGEEVAEKGFGAEAVEALLAVRQIGHREYTLLKEEAMEWERRFEDEGLDAPTVNIGDGEVSIFDALREMGDRRGYWMPRIRKPGRYLAYAFKDGENPQMQKFDVDGGALVPGTRRHWAAKMLRQGYRIKFEISDTPSEESMLDVNLVAMNDQFRAILDKMKTDDDVTLPGRLSDLNLKGHKGETADGISEYVIEGNVRKALKDVFMALGGQHYAATKGGVKAWHFHEPVRGFEKKMIKALTTQIYGEAMLVDSFGKNFAVSIAQMIHSRGSRSTKIGRSDKTGVDVVKGYEEDIPTAFALSGSGLAGGSAKRNFARRAMQAMTGMEETWLEYLKRNLEEDTDINSAEGRAERKRIYDMYEAEIEENRLDSAMQPIAYKESRDYVMDILRNDTGVERLIGKVRGLAAIKYLSSVSSALVNLSSIVTVVPAALKAFGDIPMASHFRLIGRAGREYLQYVTHRKTGKGAPLTGKAATLFDEIRKRGWDAPLQNMEAVSALETFAGRGARRVTDAMMLAFSATEQMNRATTIAAAYYGLVEQGYTHEAALTKAKYISDKAHAVYGKENLPSWARGSNAGAQFGRSYYMFKGYSHNWAQILVEMGMKGDAKAVAYMMIAPTILAGAGATGLPREWAKRFAAWIMGAMGLDVPDDIEGAVYDWVGENYGDYAKQVAYGGLTGAVGVNIQGSLRSDRGLIPTTMAELLGAPASVVSDVVTGVSEGMSGNWLKSMEKLAPRMVSGIPKAIRERTDGVTTASGRTVFYGDKPLAASGFQALVRGVGFNPIGLSMKTEAQWNERTTAAQYDEQKSELYTRLRGMLRGGRLDKAEYARWLQDVEEWNARVRAKRPQGVTQVTDSSIWYVAKDLKTPPKSERDRAAGGAKMKDDRLGVTMQELLAGRKVGSGRERARKRERGL